MRHYARSQVVVRPCEDLTVARRRRACKKLVAQVSLATAAATGITRIITRSVVGISTPKHLVPSGRSGQAL